MASHHLNGHVMVSNSLKGWYFKDGAYKEWKKTVLPKLVSCSEWSHHIHKIIQKNEEFFLIFKEIHICSVLTLSQSPANSCTWRTTYEISCYPCVNKWNKTKKLKPSCFVHFFSVTHVRGVWTQRHSVNIGTNFVI